MDDTELDLELDNAEIVGDSKLKVKNRFSKLSEKVTLANKEKEEAVARAQAIEAEKALLARERDFHKGLSEHIGKHPQASGYQDKIWEKVNKGYTTEDAIVAVLNAEGKLTSQPQQQYQPQSGVAGGSSATPIPDKDKPVESMSMADKLSALQEAERKGEISLG